MKLSEYLKDNKDEIVKTIRINKVTKETGYSEYTRWMTTVCYDEIEVVDFDKLIEQIDIFEEQFRQ